MQVTGDEAMAAIWRLVSPKLEFVELGRVVTLQAKRKTQRKLQNGL